MRPTMLVLLALAACRPGTSSVGHEGFEPEPDAPGEPAGSVGPGGCTTSEPPPDARVLVNEICASNDAGATDEGGGHPDWIELYAPGPDDFPLAGLTISDDPADPGAHALDPSLVVPGGGWLVLYADGDLDQGPTHLPFSLDADGEEIGLYRGDTLLARVVFGPLPTDGALARIEDGGADFGVTLSPTPGAANGAPAAEPGPVVAEPPERCAPSLEVSDPYLLEGDTLEATVACGTGVDLLADLLAADSLSLVTRSSGPALDGATVRWTTGLADAGPVELLAVVDDPEVPGVPETAAGTAWVADAWRDPANVPVDPALYTEELGLPVLHLDPEAVVTEDYVPMRAWFDGAEYTAAIKVRGAASADYPKPSYTLEFDADQLDLDDLGLGKKDHLVLISNFDDNSYVRQKLVYDTWAALAEASGTPRLVPRTAFVVVYLDGAYHGLYTAIDHVDDEFVEEMGFDPAGNLYKSVSHDANFYLTSASGSPKGTLHEGYEKKEGDPGDFSDLDALVEFTGSADHATFAAEAGLWLDPDEFADWLLLVHWFAADDSGGKNAYFLHDTQTGLFRYTPWDFNHALGQNWYTARIPVTAYNDFVWTNRVFWHLQDDPDLAAALWDRFAVQRAPGGPFDPALLQDLLDDYYGDIEPSAERDWDRWIDPYWSWFGWARTDRSGFVEERTLVEQWIADRAVFMDEAH